MEAETDKLYKEYKNTFFTRYCDLPCCSKINEQRQAQVDAVAKKYNASLMKEKEIKTYKPMVIRTMRRTWLAE